jgi:serine/threonine protein kinase
MPATQTFRTNATRYELLSPIHQGPTTTVWRARDTLAGLDVVVKELNGASAMEPVARARMREESRLSESVSHPGVVPVIDELFADDRAAIVFPHVPGRTLAERLRDEDPIPPRQAAQIALEVGDVLAAAHAAGVVHRDVKPGNVLLADDGRVRLLDFGIARTEATSLEMTGSGMAIGTLPYMAPEQLTGSDTSPAADVFALGVMLYETLSGARPFNGRSPAEQLELHGRPPPSLDPPEALSTLVAAMLNPLARERPSAEQVGRTLRGWLDGRYEAEAVTAPVALPSRDAVGRRSVTPWFVGAGAAFVITLLAAASLIGFRTVPPAVVNQPTPAPATRDAPVVPAVVPNSGPNEANGDRPTSDDTRQDRARQGDDGEGKKKGHHKGNSNRDGEGDDDRGEGDDDSDEGDD